MEYGIIKKGDVVKYNEEAWSEIPSSIDKCVHVVDYVTVFSDGSEHVMFEDGDAADAYWLELVTEKK